MTRDSETMYFNGLDVELFTKEKGISDPSGKAYKIMVNYEESEEQGIKISDKFKDFIKDPNIEQVQALIIGNWEYSYESSHGLFDLMLENSDKLKGLKALYVGEMDSEECEISWIIQSDYNKIVSTFKNLEILRIRGGSDLRLSSLKHENLKQLIIETGGLSTDTIEDIIKSELPNLEHLELWLGVDDYGFEGDLNTIKPLYNNNLFPKLNSLALRNSELTDEIAEALSNHPILDQLNVLDLSLGTLSDKGAGFLLSSPKVAKLVRLDIHYHFMSDEMMKKMENLDTEVLAFWQQEEDEYDGEKYRYVYVSE